MAWTSSEPGVLDMMAAGASKGEGVRTLAGLLGIPLGQVCAFGDCDNDLPMLTASGFPVAMENGCGAAKSAALVVAPSHDEDGVARVLEECIRNAHTH